MPFLETPEDGTVGQSVSLSNLTNCNEFTVPSSRYLMRATHLPECGGWTNASACQFLLLYLNADTFVGEAGDALEMEVHAAISAGVEVCARFNSPLSM